MNRTTRTDSDRKMGPWEALGAVAILMLLILGFIFAIAAIIKWAIG